MKSSIFFSEQLGDYIVDELCKCNHLKSEHGSKVTRMDGGSMLRDPNKGSCCSGGCCCKRFKFERFVTVAEAAEIVASKRLLVIA